MIAHPEKRFYLQNTESVQFFIIMSVLISFYSVVISAVLFLVAKLRMALSMLPYSAVAVSSAIFTHAVFDPVQHDPYKAVFIQICDKNFLFIRDGDVF